MLELATEYLGEMISMAHQGVYQYVLMCTILLRKSSGHVLREAFINQPIDPGSPLLKHFGHVKISLIMWSSQ